jgi:flagellar hook-basal body complex protein FliE
MLNPISAIKPIPMPGMNGATGASSAASGSFGDILQGALNSVNALNNEAGNAVQDFISGKNQELHTVAVSAQRAELAFELGLQVRNKVVSAYQEIMKMQL